MTELRPLLERSTFVLVHPFFPENIGAVARSLHAYGIAQMKLVEGRGLESHPAAKASALAAAQLLEAAPCDLPLSTLVKQGDLVFAATNRHPKRRLLTPEEAAALALASPGKVLLLLGNEKNGLSDAQIALADAAVRIPTRTEGGSLNLAQAATVLAHAWSNAAGCPQKAPASGKQALAGEGELESNWALISAKLEALGLWSGAEGPKRAISLKRLLARSQPDLEELEALKALVMKLGLLAKAEKTQQQEA